MLSKDLHDYLLPIYEGKSDCDGTDGALAQLIKNFSSVPFRWTRLETLWQKCACSSSRYARMLSTEFITAYSGVYFLPTVQESGKDHGIPQPEGARRSSRFLRCFQWGLSFETSRPSAESSYFVTSLHFAANMPDSLLNSSRLPANLLSFRTDHASTSIRRISRDVHGDEPKWSRFRVCNQLQSMLGSSFIFTTTHQRGLLSLKQDYGVRVTWSI